MRALTAGAPPRPFHGPHGRAAAWRRIDVAVLLGWAALLLFFVPLSGLDRYLGNQWTGLVPLPAFVIALGCIAPAFALALVVGTWRDNGRRFLGLYAAMAPVLLALSLLTLVRLAGALLPGANWEEGGKHVITPLLNFAVFVLCAGAVALPGAVRAVRGALLLAYAAFAATVVIDYLHPGTFATFSNRSSGFMQNANLAGRLIIFLTVAQLDWSRFRIFDAALLAVSALLVLLTLSRSGMVLMALVLGFYGLSMLAAHRSQLQLGTIAAVAAAGAVAAVGAMAIVQTMSAESVFARAVGERLGFFQAVVTQDTSQVIDGESRAALIPQYLDLIVQAPLAGHGPGFNRALGMTPSHNVYLEIWSQHGFPGLLALCLFLGTTILWFAARRDRRGLAFGVVYAVGGVFTHSLLDIIPFVMVHAILCSLPPSGPATPSDGRHGPVRR